GMHKLDVIASTTQESEIFFFQAEDGIRDLTVTGVQTCALPISRPDRPAGGGAGRTRRRSPRRGSPLPRSVPCRSVPLPARPMGEIGRASCRERVEVYVVDSAIKK